MANFDEDIRRITNEVLQDGTVDQIIREKVTDGIKGAISDSFGYGKLRNAIKERLEQVPRLISKCEKGGQHHNENQVISHCFPGTIE